MRKRVMILGAGREQVPIIQTCRDAGAEIIVISPPGSYPGFRYADRYYYFDVKDCKGILDIARQENIDAVLSDQLDAAVLSTAYVAEELGLPGIGYDVAVKFTNKLVMRKTSYALGVAGPRFQGVGTLDESYIAAKRIGYPVVIKPADSAASRGVYRIDNETQLKEHFGESLSYSNTGQVIIEELLEGPEFVVQSYSDGYKVHNLIIGHRDFFELPGLFIPRAAVYVDANSVSSHAERKVLAAHTRLVQGLGLKLGISYGEYIYDEKAGEAYLVEIAARGAATFTSSDLIPLASGINVNRMLVDTVLGNRQFSGPMQLRTGASAYFCFILPAGKIVKVVNGDKLDTLEGVHKVWLDTAVVGMSVPETKNKGARKGPILVSGRTKKDCYDAFQRVKEVFSIEVETQSGCTKGIQW